MNAVATRRSSNSEGVFASADCALRRENIIIALIPRPLAAGSFTSYHLALIFNTRGTVPGGYHHGSVRVNHIQKNPFALALGEKQAIVRKARGSNPFVSGIHFHIGSAVFRTFSPCFGPCRPLAAAMLFYHRSFG
jgi:hypothetical protein